MFATAEGIEGKVQYQLDNGHWNIPQLKDLLENILPQNTKMENYEVDRVDQKRPAGANGKDVYGLSGYVHKITLPK